MRLNVPPLLNFPCKKEGVFSDLSVYVNLNITKVNEIKQAPKWMKIERFTVLKQSAENEILNLPVTATTGNNDNSIWETVFIDIFHEFINRFMEEIKEAFSQDNF